MKSIALKQDHPLILWGVEVFAGSLFIALCSLIYLPTLPIATTLQTFGLFILALTLGAEKTFFAASLYLIEATTGWPVLCGCSHSLWWMGPSAGYLIAFPFAGYLAGKIGHSASSFGRQIVAIGLGKFLIYGMGWAHLSSFIGSYAAFTQGVLFFLPTACLKILAIAALIRKKR